VLVLVERSWADRTVCRSTYALLTIARRLGTPVAVLCRPAASTRDAASIALLGRFGARTVCTVTSPEMDEYPAACRVETLVELARRMSPAAIVIAIDVRMGPDGPIATQSALGRSYLVESSVVRGIPVFTVRADAVAPEEAPLDPVVDRVDVTFPESIRRVRLLSRVPKPAGHRPDLTAAAVVPQRSSRNASSRPLGGIG
jgi:electron transfer flavoprotein alpha subunit